MTKQDLITQAVAALSTFRVPRPLVIVETVEQKVAFDLHDRKLDEIEALLTSKISEAWEAGEKSRDDYADERIARSYADGAAMGRIVGRTALRERLVEAVKGMKLKVGLDLASDLHTVKDHNAVCNKFLALLQTSVEEQKNV